MDGLIVILVLVGVAAIILGPLGFFIAAGHGTRLRILEADVRQLRAAAAGSPKASEAELADMAASWGQPAAGPIPAEPAVAAKEKPAAEPETILREPAAAAATEAAQPAGANEPPPLPPRAEPKPEAAPAPEPKPTAATPPRRRRSLEESLGTRWTVWVGGAALALGALLLVRYSIEQGYFGPATRVVIGLLLSFALIGAGESLRRREAPVALGALPGVDAAYIPGVLTAAGVTGAFGAVYAAHALYAFIGPATAFFVLGLLAIGALAAALVHGPALAGLGLVGALATPALVSSQHPQPWPVVLYLAVVAAAAYALSGLRRWLWLAGATAFGAAAWTIALHSGVGAYGQGAPWACLVLQTALAGLAFAILPSLGLDDSHARFDPIATGVLTAFAALGAYLLLPEPSLEWPAFAWTATAGAMVLVLLAVATRAAPTSFVATAAGLLALAAMAHWPAMPAQPQSVTLASAGAWLPDSVTPEILAFWPPPLYANHFELFSALCALVVALASVRRLAAGAQLGQSVAAGYAVAGALTPLGTLAMVDLRVEQGAVSSAMALAAGLVGAAYVTAARRFRSGSALESPVAIRLGLGAFAAAAVAALSEGLVFALDGGALTVALALAALACAYLAVRLELAALRWCVAALGALVAGRLAYDPRVVGEGLSTTPIFNWLLFGYGVPAVAFAVAGRLLARARDDIPTRVADSLAVLFSAFLVFFEIRHAMNGGDPFAPSTGLIEQGLMSVASLAFAIALIQLDAARANIVFRLASYGLGALGFADAVLGLLLAHNPYLDRVPVAGGRVLNALLLGYLAPAILAAALAILAKARRPVWYWGSAGLLSVALGLAYLLLQVRVFFHGPEIGENVDFSLAETGVEVCVLIVCAWLAFAASSLWPALTGGAEAAIGAALLIGLFALGIVVNPYAFGGRIDGAFWNALIPAYALPALLAAGIAHVARRRERLTPTRIAGVAAILFVFAYATLETRRAFQGPDILYTQSTSNAEFYAYSAVWLLLGVALLAYGILRKSREARLASAVFVLATTLKVFVFDLAGLEGPLRALSFLGLGAALIGIGLVYQRIVFAKPAPSGGADRGAAGPGHPE